jgi:PAS domain-containing protein
LGRERGAAHREEHLRARPAGHQVAERFELLLDAVTDYAIYMLDLADGVAPAGTPAPSAWNAGARRYKGYTADEIIGQHFSRFYTEETGPPGYRIRACASPRGGPLRGRMAGGSARTAAGSGRSVVIDPSVYPSDGA